MVRAVFLDRDGVLNRALVRDGKPYAPATIRGLEILDGVPAALEKLKALGFLLIVVSNQPEVARGSMARQAVEEIHHALRAALPLDDVLVCYHDDRDACQCRKPQPGLLLEAARRHDIDLPASFLVGDRWRDIDAGHNAGCRTVFIDHGYRERAPARPPDVCVYSLLEAADWICSGSVGNGESVPPLR